ncbi:MAG: hypothetical protein ACRDRG_17085 [Pseudonocardiaceae bacterium]
MLDVGTDQAQKFDELRRRVDERGWWEEYSDVVVEAIEMLVRDRRGCQHCAQLRQHDIIVDLQTG